VCTAATASRDKLLRFSKYERIFFLLLLSKSAYSAPGSVRILLLYFLLVCYERRYHHCVQLLDRLRTSILSLLVCHQYSFHNLHWGWRRWRLKWWRGWRRWRCGDSGSKRFCRSKHQHYRGIGRKSWWFQRRRASNCGSGLYCVFIGYYRSCFWRRPGRQQRFQLLGVSGRKGRVRWWWSW
jgi:hypothetical protein